MMKMRRHLDFQDQNTPIQCDSELNLMNLIDLVEKKKLFCKCLKFHYEKILQ